MLRAWGGIMKSSLVLTASALALLLGPACGGDDSKEPLFQPQPACEGDEIVPFQGDSSNVISNIEIGSLEDGFDLDGTDDQDCLDASGLCPDNKLAAVGSLAGSAIRDAVAGYDILIPVEYFDGPDGDNDECVKFGIYLGHYKQDTDADGKDTAIDGGDCDDTRSTSAPGNGEVADNLLDDDCDGYADGSPTTPSGNTVDNDGDTFSPADGDCDDTTETGASSFPGNAEVCGDGLDNDCDGVADRSADPNLCDPYTTQQTIDIDPLSFDDHGDPLIAFDNGKIENGVLTAGPSIFAVQVPTGLDDLVLDLEITGATIEANVVTDANGAHLENGRLGGVLDVRTMDRIRGLTVDQINLTPDDSLLDATFANVLGTILGLQHSKQTDWVRCMVPDIDVDRDGLEAFCDSNPNDDDKSVDICVDGDGTVVMDEGDTQCTEALLPDGTARFRDGVSVELNFTTSPALLRAP
jgi:hypothetical protein